MKIAATASLCQMNASRLPSGEKVAEPSPIPQCCLQGSGVLRSFRMRPPFAVVTETVACLPNWRVLNTISFPFGDQDGSPFSPFGVSERSPLPSALIV